MFINPGPIVVQFRSGYSEEINSADFINNNLERQYTERSFEGPFDPLPLKKNK